MFHFRSVLFLFYFAVTFPVTCVGFATYFFDMLKIFLSCHCFYSCFIASFHDVFLLFCQFCYLFSKLSLLCLVGVMGQRGGGGGLFTLTFLKTLPSFLHALYVNLFTRTKHVANIVLTSKCCFPFVSKCHLFSSTKFCSHYSSTFLLFAIVLLLFSLPSLAGMVLYVLSSFDLLSRYQLSFRFSVTSFLLLFCCFSVISLEGYTLFLACSAIVSQNVSLFSGMFCSNYLIILFCFVLSMF